MHTYMHTYTHTNAWLVLASTDTLESSARALFFPSSIFRIILHRERKKPEERVSATRERERECVCVCVCVQETGRTSTALPTCSVYRLVSFSVTSTPSRRTFAMPVSSIALLYSLSLRERDRRVSARGRERERVRVER